MKALTLILTRGQTREAQAWWDAQAAEITTTPDQGGFYAIGNAALRVAGFRTNPATVEIVMVSPRCGREIQAALDRERERAELRHYVRDLRDAASTYLSNDGSKGRYDVVSMVEARDKLSALLDSPIIT